MSEEKLIAAAILVSALFDALFHVGGRKFVVAIVLVQLATEEILSRLVALRGFGEGANHLKLAIVHLNDVDRIDSALIHGDELGLVQKAVKCPLGNAYTSPKLTLKLVIRAGDAPQERVKYFSVFVIHIEGIIPRPFHLSTEKKKKMLR